MDRRSILDGVARGSGATRATAFVTTEIQEIVLTTNLIPRKCLGFKTPFQALIAELGKDFQIRFS
jgi:hypothetical protein